MIIQDFLDEYARYRKIGERALEQIPDDALNTIPCAEGNSAAMIVYHLSGNLQSRFTNFLTDDGEKPWRVRDKEFANRSCTRPEVEEAWIAGWAVLEGEVGGLSDNDLGSEVVIRKQQLTVHAALCRSLAHVSYHVGQVVLIARMSAAQDWRWISIPKGGSDAYNAKPTLEKAPQ